MEEPVMVWSSQDLRVAKVGPAGVVRAVAPGVARITATAGGTASGTVQFFMSDPEYAVLAALCCSTGGDGWTRNDNWGDDDPLGDWYGVETDSVGRVTALDLEANNLVGRIPPKLGDLASNELADKVPAQMGRLAAPEELLLGDDPPSGPLPLSLKELQYLRTFGYDDTDLCVPDDESFRKWLGSIANHRGTGVAGGARGEGVCDRIPRVRDAIMDKAGRADCAAVGATVLAGGTELDLRGPPKLFAVGDDCSSRLSKEAWRRDNARSMADARQTGVRSNAPELHELLSHDFAELTALASLSLQDNWLVELPDGVFYDLGALRYLDLSRNILTALPDGVFGGPLRVASIPFRGNRIAQLPDGVFDDLGNLTSIDFAHNQISELGRGSNYHQRFAKVRYMPKDKGHYYFRNGLSCLYEMPTSNARRLLPPHLQPLEIQHELSILSVTAFDFYKGDGGIYQELVLSILVPPLLKPGEALPKAALYPFIVGTSTEFGRREGIQRWRLPHLMRDIDVDFTEREGEISVAVSTNGDPICEMRGTSYEFEPVELLFHTFITDSTGNYKSNLTMRGEGYSEHEFERGSLTLYEHEMTSGLNCDEIADYPFREQWMKGGVEIFSPLESI